MIRSSRWSIVVLSVLLASVNVSHGAQPGAALQDNVAIQEVSGGDKTNPLWDSRFGNDEFRRALSRSLESRGLLAAAKIEARYLLSAALESCSLPSAGFDVMTLVKYSLVDTFTGIEILHESIQGEGATSFSGSFFMGKKSLTENSIRNNIRTLTGKLFEMGPRIQEATLLP